MFLHPQRETVNAELILADYPKVKRDKGTEETYILTLEFEGRVLNQEQATELDEVLPGALRALEADVGEDEEEEASRGKTKGKLEIKGDSTPFKLDLGYFDGENNRKLILRGQARIIHTCLKYSSDDKPELTQRVRVSDFDLDALPALYRRAFRVVSIALDPVQLTLPFEKAAK